MTNAIDQRFDQPSFDTYAKMESLLIKTLNSQDKSQELKFMEKLYNNDVNSNITKDVEKKSIALSYVIIALSATLEKLNINPQPCPQPPKKIPSRIRL